MLRYLFALILSLSAFAANAATIYWPVTRGDGSPVPNAPVTYGLGPLQTNLVRGFALKDQLSTQADTNSLVTFSNLLVGQWTATVDTGVDTTTVYFQVTNATQTNFITDPGIQILPTKNPNGTYAFTMAQSDGRYLRGVNFAGAVVATTNATTGVVSANIIGGSGGSGVAVAAGANTLTATNAVGTNITVTISVPATNAATAGAIVQRDSSGNFSAGTITASLTGNASTATSSTSYTGQNSGDVTGPQSATVVAQVGGVSAANVASGANAANAATTSGTANAIVKRTSDGSISAGGQYMHNVIFGDNVNGGAGTGHYGVTNIYPDTAFYCEGEHIFDFNVQPVDTTNQFPGDAGFVIRNNDPWQSGSFWGCSYTGTNAVNYYGETGNILRTVAGINIYEYDRYGIVLDMVSENAPHYDLPHTAVLGMNGLHDFAFFNNYSLNGGGNEDHPWFYNQASTHTFFFTKQQVGVLTPADAGFAGTMSINENTNGTGANTVTVDNALNVRTNINVAAEKVTNGLTAGFVNTSALTNSGPFTNSGPASFATNVTLLGTIGGNNWQIGPDGAGDLADTAISWDAAGNLAAVSYAGIGTGLTALNAANLGSGTVPLARLSNINSNNLDAATKAQLALAGTGSGSAFPLAADANANGHFVTNGYSTLTTYDFGGADWNVMAFGAQVSTTLADAMSNAGKTAANNAAIIAAYNAAGVLHGEVKFPEGFFGVATNFVVTSPCSFVGAGWQNAQGSMTNNSQTINAPVTYPYLGGTVIVQNASNCDFFNPSVSASAVNFAHIAFLENTNFAFHATGDGIRNLCKPTGTNGDFDIGMHNFWINDCMFWGIDGNHAAIHTVNSILGGGDHDRSVGGGLFLIEQTNLYNAHYGNMTWTECFGALCQAGTGNGIEIRCSNPTYADNRISFKGCQINGADLKIPGTTPPTSAQKLVTASSQNTCILFDGYDFENDGLTGCLFDYLLFSRCPQAALHGGGIAAGMPGVSSGLFNGSDIQNYGTIWSDLQGEYAAETNKTFFVQKENGPALVASRTDGSGENYISFFDGSFNSWNFGTTTVLSDDLNWDYPSVGSNSNLMKLTAPNGNLFVRSNITAQAFILNSGVQILSGSGTPQSAVTAPVGSIFLRSDGGTSTTLYVKETGTGNTGWVAK